MEHYKKTYKKKKTSSEDKRQIQLALYYLNDVNVVLFNVKTGK